MYRNYFVNGIILLMAIVMVTGCAQTPEKTGALTHAVKDDSAPTGDVDTFPVRDDAPVFGDITDDPDAAGYGLCKRVHFDYDKADIKEEYKECLNNIARFAKDFPNKLILAEGHCDERGTEEYNIALGERRANSIIGYLVELGVPSSQLVSKSWGESRPLATGSDESAWKLNRRADFFSANSAR